VLFFEVLSFVKKLGIYVILTGKDMKEKEEITYGIETAFCYIG
jgi:hypothetical protein